MVVFVVIIVAAAQGIAGRIIDLNDPIVVVAELATVLVHIAAEKSPAFSCRRCRLFCRHFSFLFLFWFLHFEFVLVSRGRVPALGTVFEGRFFRFVVVQFAIFVFAGVFVLLGVVGIGFFEH